MARRVRIILYLVILTLVILIIYSLKMQSGIPYSEKVVEAGLIESGDSPAIYFILRNTGNSTAWYTYTVTYNNTNGEVISSPSNVSVPPGKTFTYSISLVRPSSGVIFLNLVIIMDTPDPVLLHNQTWIIRSQI